MHDLAVIVVSTNDVEWLKPCLTTVYERAGDLDLDVVIADNDSSDGTAELIRDEFPRARVVPCRNRGFGHANNRAVMTCDSRYVLFLNPDTELLDGSLSELVSLLDGRPEIGLASVKQLTADGTVYPTIRRFPSALRAVGEAIGSERFPRSLGWVGPRVLDPRVYQREVECDWLTGAFMLVRAEALLGAGIFDERFFMSSEEIDLAYRIRRGGWRVVHLPSMSILHHVHMGKPLGLRMEAQYAFARRQYAEKHLSAVHRAVYLSVLRTGHRLRLLRALADGAGSYRREAARRALRTLRGLQPPPFGPPPASAVAPPSSSAPTSGLQPRDVRSPREGALIGHMQRPNSSGTAANGHPNGNVASNGHLQIRAEEALARDNGLAGNAPSPGQRILVAGGAGYIGSVLVPRLLDRGYRVRVLDRLYFGAGPLAAVKDRIELVVADVRELPDSALRDVDGVINLSGLSNDPTAEFNPEANWQMNALATETLGRACLAHGIERYVFASSCSLYDGLPPGMHGEDAAVEPRAAYATSKRYGEERLLELAEEGLCPVILRNGTVYGWSPRMRFDLVVNTFVKDALLSGALKLHGGGWMWRPLVEVRDCADAMIAAYEAPAERVRAEIFNVVHSNYQIRELAMIVAGSVELTGRRVQLEEVPGLKLNRNYECANAKLSTTLGFIPRRSVLEAVTEILTRLDPDDRIYLTDPRAYNIRWLELLHDVKPMVDSFASVL